MTELAPLMHCFQGIVPTLIATCARDGTPNVTYLSQVHYVDEKHVALSCQFFNKTRRNIDENPYASVQIYDPLTLEAYQLELRFDHSETSGPLFDTMAARIQAIASHTGMAGVFRLLSADVYEVLSLEPATGFVEAAPQGEVLASPPPFRTEIRALHAISERLTRAGTLDELLSSLLAALRDELGFDHSMVLLRDEGREQLYTVASLGYGEDGIGAEVAIGEGFIGTAAARKKTLRVSGVDAELRYARAVRRAASTSGAKALPEIPLPGLPDAQSHLAIPLLSRGCLVGVLAVESRNPLGFEEWHEAFLDIVGNQAATAIENMMLREEPDDAAGASPGVARETRRRRTFTLYKNDDCVFVDGEYLIRNVPGRILWKILRGWAEGRRTDFTNRELRLDPSLGLPPVKDNLESRLILLRKRLEQKCQDVRIVPKSRGQFRLELDADVELVEKDSA